MDANDRSIVRVVMVSHGLVHTYELTIPIMMVAWLSEFSTTEATLGAIVAVGYGLFGLGALPSGIVADRLGSQRLIAGCLVGMGASFALLSVAPSLEFVLVAVALWGAAASVYHPSGLSLISTGVKDTGNGFAYHGMAGNAGIALGPLLAVLLLLFVGWRTVALALAVPAFVAVAFILQADIDESAATNLAADGSGTEESPDVSSLSELFDASRRLFVGGFVVVFLVVVFNGLYYRGILTFLPELLANFVGGGLLELDGAVSERLNPSDFVYIGLLMVGIAGQYVGGKALDRIEVEKGLLAGYAILVLIALLYVPASASGAGLLVVTSLLLGFFLFALQPMYQFAVAEYSPPNTRGLAYGYTYLAQFGVGALGAAVTGFVLTYAATPVAFLVLAGFALVAAGVSTYLYWRSRTVADTASIDANQTR
jgi:MFS family permease